MNGPKLMYTNYENEKDRKTAEIARQVNDIIISHLPNSYDAQDMVPILIGLTSCLAGAIVNCCEFLKYDKDKMELIEKMQKALKDSTLEHFETAKKQTNGG